MNTNIKAIGIFNSGGDCAGLNQAMRAVVKKCHQLGIKVYGFYDGDEGAVNEENIQELHNNFFDGYINTSGTVLGSRRSGIINLQDRDPNSKNIKAYTSEEKDLEKFKANLKKFKIDGLIFTGGNGTMYAMSILSKLVGVPCIGIPKTIDNDTPQTEYSLGYDTCANQTVSAIENLKTSSYSHNTTMIVETMGNTAGYIALNAGICVGADAILIPEADYDIDSIYLTIQNKQQESRKKSTIVVVSEGISLLPQDKGHDKYRNLSKGQYIVEKLKEKGLTDVRANILGHIQRGGIPSAKDKLMANLFAVKAVNALLKGESKKMVCLKDNKISTVDFIKVAEETTKKIEHNDYLITTAKQIGIYIGNFNFKKQDEREVIT